jgi:hypothetical protein
MTTQNDTAADANANSASRETHEIEAMPDKWGNQRDMELDRYPETSAAREGQATPPSGQGGASPKSRPDYQDMFPANPEPSETAKAWGERVDELGPVEAASRGLEDFISQSGTGSDTPNKGTESAVSETP